MVLSGIWLHVFCVIKCGTVVYLFRKGSSAISTQREILTVRMTVLFHTNFAGLILYLYRRFLSFKGLFTTYQLSVP